MAKGFTDIAIRNLKAGTQRQEIPDAGAKGLYLVVQPSGKKSFAVRYRANGVPRKLTLPKGCTLAAARKLAADALLAVEQGHDPAITKREVRAKAEAANAATVQALCEAYFKRESGKLRTAHERQLVLQRLVYPEIGKIPLADLKRSDVVEMLDKIEDKNGTKMSDLVLAFIRRIFRWHESRTDDFVSPIVSSMVRYDAAANRGTRVLTDDEIRKLWAATEPKENVSEPFHALVRFLLLTGARRSEANEMPRAEVKNGVWTLPPERNKIKAELTRPLSQAAQRVLATVPVVEGVTLAFSLTGRVLHLTKPTEALRQAIGAADIRLHDLRRSTRTLLSRAGVSADIAEWCLGHALPGIRGTYDKHTYIPEMLQAYEALATLIDNIVNDRGDRVVPIRRKAPH